MSVQEERRFQENTLVRKVRRIPVPGEILVKVGDSVTPQTVVARGTVVNPDIRDVSVALQLGVHQEETEKYLLKKKGDKVKAGEVIAIRRSFFGRSTKLCRSPIDGTIEDFSKSSGKALIRGEPLPIEVKAHIPGKVVETIPGEGAVIECEATLIRGMFGVGGETLGGLVIPVERADEVLTTEHVLDEHRGKVLVGGSIVTIDALRRASKVGVNGIVVGGVDQKDLTEILGYEIGIGVTGKETIGFTLILTEGFGVQPMDERTFNLLKLNRDRVASIDGSTQIRTRMLRPEVIIPS
jgi:hypothetical protein